MPEPQQDRLPDPDSDDIDYRMMVPLFAHVLVAQMSMPLMRVTTSYRALELDLSVIWIGAIAASFAVLPMLVAVPAGRLIDRHGSPLGLRIGTGMLLAAGIGFWMWPSSGLHLVLYNVLLGLGSLFCITAQQTLAVRCGGVRARDRVFGNYVFTASLGQALGPFVLTMLSGSGAIPSTGRLFFACFMCSLLLLAILLLLPHRANFADNTAGDETQTVGEIMRIKGMLMSFVVSVLSTTSMDLMIVYLPVLGLERNISAAVVGWLLAVRALTSMGSRFFYATLVAMFGREHLMRMSLLAAGLGILAIAFPLPVPLMFLAMIVFGFGLGLTTALSLSEVIEMVPVNVRGTALSLRMVGNRAGQLILPVAAGFIATAVGTGAVFGLIGLAMTGTLAARFRRG